MNLKIRHGHAAGGSETPTYKSWMNMMTRVRNPNRAKWHRYGGRGITVCDRWLVFENFLSDMGERPEGRSLDRINNNGNYEPGNCRWATPREQRLNSRRTLIITFKDESLPISEWAKRLHIPLGTLWSRITAGWPPERALVDRTYCAYCGQSGTDHEHSCLHFEYGPDGKCVDCGQPKPKEAA